MNFLLLLDNGSVFAVGFGGNGGLGDQIFQSMVPIQVMNLENIIAIQVGFQHALFYSSNKKKRFFFSKET